MKMRVKFNILLKKKTKQHLFSLVHESMCISIRYISSYVTWVRMFFVERQIVENKLSESWLFDDRLTLLYLIRTNYEPWKGLPKHLIIEIEKKEQCNYLSSTKFFVDKKHRIRYYFTLLFMVIPRYFIILVSIYH
jgi:hypothetical protein